MLKKIYQSLKTTKELGKSGKIHKKILSRLYIMFVMLVIALGIIVYDIIIGRLNPSVALLCITITTILGFFMSRMNKIVWDEKQELLVAGKMDWTNGAVLALYMAARFTSKYFLNNIYHNAAAAFAISMSILVGFALGRFLGIAFTVRKTYLARKK